MVQWTKEFFSFERKFNFNEKDFLWELRNQRLETFSACRP